MGRDCSREFKNFYQSIFSRELCPQIQISEKFSIYVKISNIFQNSFEKLTYQKIYSSVSERKHTQYCIEIMSPTSEGLNIHYIGGQGLRKLTFFCFIVDLCLFLLELQVMKTLMQMIVDNLYNSVNPLYLLCLYISCSSRNLEPFFMVSVIARHPFSVFHLLIHLILYANTAKAKL